MKVEVYRVPELASTDFSGVASVGVSGVCGVLVCAQPGSGEEGWLNIA
jgi:hypothetical protein